MHVMHRRSLMLRRMGKNGHERVSRRAKIPLKWRPLLGRMILPLGQVRHVQRYQNCASSDQPATSSPGSSFMRFCHVSKASPEPAKLKLLVRGSSEQYSALS